MTEQESKDLQALKDECDAIRKRSFSSMKYYSRLTDQELKSSGFPNREAAITSIYKSGQKKIDNLTAEHIKKYPDTKS